MSPVPESTRLIATLRRHLRHEGRTAPRLARELTLAQEKALSSGAFLSFLFIALLGRQPARRVRG